MEYFDALRHLEGVALTIPVAHGTQNPKLKALGLAVDAMQKQIPAPLKIEADIQCPVCNTAVVAGPKSGNRPLYCRQCGQAFCWCSVDEAAEINP